MLEQSFYGNSVLTWLFAAGSAVVAAVAVVALRRVAVRSLTARASGPYAGRVASALAALEGTRPWFLSVVALFVGAQFVALPSKADRFVDDVTLIAVIVQCAFWASKAMRRWLAHRIEASRETDAAAATTVTVLGFFAQLGLWSLVALLALENLGFNITALLAGLGVGGVAVALAAQSILGDVFASITIALDKPFAIGDFITFDDIMGTVESIGLKTTRLRSLSGEQIVISNTELLKSKLRNFKRLHERRIEFSLGVPLDTPAVKLAMIPGILRGAIEAQSRARFERAHFKKFGDSQLVFEAAFYVSDPDYNRYMDVQQAINLVVYARLQHEGVVPVRQPVPSPKGAEAQENARKPGPPIPAREQETVR
jgi:small-conductance mechanosensitive channel